MSKRIRVALCDNSPTLRMGLKNILDSDPYIVTVLETSGQDELLENHIDSEIDIILADVQPDDPASFNCLNEIKKYRPDIKIIIFSACANKEAIMKSLEVGAQGFHDKSASPEEIIEAVHTVHKGGNSLAPCITTTLVSYISAKNEERKAELSQREEQVLNLIAEGKSNSDIADQLYISVRTVKFHVSSIFSKLNVKNRTEAASMWTK